MGMSNIISKNCDIISRTLTGKKHSYQLKLNCIRWWQSMFWCTAVRTSPLNRVDKRKIEAAEITFLSSKALWDKEKNSDI